MSALLWLPVVGIVCYLVGHRHGRSAPDDLVRDLGHLGPGTLVDLRAHGDIVRSGDRFRDDRRNA
jgi:hypothetical protein